MAKIRTCALFFTTSPRSPEKMIPEIKLLVENFANQKWEKDTQQKFIKLLAASEFFKGKGSLEEPSFSSRDRISRAPKSLGFIELEPEIKLTAQGKRFIYGTDPSEPYTDQLMKYQLPSPFHEENVDTRGRFFIRPFLELLRLVHDLGFVTKDEIIIFFLVLTDYHNYLSTLNAISQFRKMMQESENQGAILIRYKENVIRSIFASEINNGQTVIRGKGVVSIDIYIKTKQNNLKDYADALIRYIVFTGLVCVEGGAADRRLVVNKEKLQEIERILKDTQREPVFIHQVDEYKKYLFNS